MPHTLFIIKLILALIVIGPMYALWFNFWADRTNYSLAGFFMAIHFPILLMLIGYAVYLDFSK